MESLFLWRLLGRDTTCPSEPRGRQLSVPRLRMSSPDRLRLRSGMPRRPKPGPYSWSGTPTLPKAAIASLDTGIETVQERHSNVYDDNLRFRVAAMRTNARPSPTVATTSYFGSSSLL